MPSGLVGVSSKQFAELQAKANSQLVESCPLSSPSISNSNLVPSRVVPKAPAPPLPSGNYDPAKAVRIATDPTILVPPPGARKTPEEVAPLLPPMIPPSKMPKGTDPTYNCCANFVSAVLINAGAPIVHTTSAPQLEQELYAAKWTNGNISDPKPGDVVMLSEYDAKSNSWIPAHTELVSGPGDWLVGSNDKTVNGKLLPQVIGIDRISWAPPNYRVTVLTPPK